MTGMTSPLKKKQVALLGLIRQHGPISARSLAMHVHGVDDYISCTMISRQIRSMSRRGLIRPRIGDRETGRRGIKPMVWSVCEGML